MAENNAVNSAILQLTATDLDSADNADFDYVISDVTAYCADAAGCSDDDVTNTSSRVFHVDPHSGVLSVTVSVDREMYSHFRVAIFAVDRGFPAQTGSTMVEVIVDDVNDQQPTFLLPQDTTGTSNGGLELSVSEDATDGQVVGHLRAVDRDVTITNNRVYYSFRSSQTSRQPAKFVVDSDTGEVRLRGRLDRERESRYIMTAVVTDSGRPALSTVAQLVVKVLGEWFILCRHIDVSLLRQYRALVLSPRTAADVLYIFSNDVAPVLTRRSWSKSLTSMTIIQCSSSRRHTITLSPSQPHCR